MARQQLPSLLSTKHHGLAPTFVVGLLLRISAALLLHSDRGLAMPGRRSYRSVVGPLTVQQLKRQQRDAKYRAFPGQGFSFLRVASEQKEDVRAMAVAKSIKNDREVACQSPANDGWRASVRARARGLISSGVLIADLRSYKRRADAWHGSRVPLLPPGNLGFGVTGLVDSWEQLDDSPKQIVLQGSHAAIFGPTTHSCHLESKTVGFSSAPPGEGFSAEPPIPVDAPSAQVAHVGVQANIGLDVGVQTPSGCEVGVQVTSGTNLGVQTDCTVDISVAVDPSLGASVAPVTICLDTALFSAEPPGSDSSLVSRIQCEQVLAFLLEENNVAVAPCNVSEVDSLFIAIGDELHEEVCKHVDAGADFCTHSILHEELYTQDGVHEELSLSGGFTVDERVPEQYKINGAQFCGVAVLSCVFWLACFVGGASMAYGATQFLRAIVGSQKFALTAIILVALLALWWQECVVFFYDFVLWLGRGASLCAHGLKDVQADFKRCTGGGLTIVLGLHDYFVVLGGATSVLAGVLLFGGGLRHAVGCASLFVSLWGYLDVLQAGGKLLFTSFTNASAGIQRIWRFAAYTKYRKLENLAVHDALINVGLEGGSAALDHFSTRSSQRINDIEKMKVDISKIIIKAGP